MIGFAAGPIPKIPLNLVLLKGAQIVGVFWGSFTAREPERHQANIRELMDWYMAGKLKPRRGARRPRGPAGQGEGRPRSAPLPHGQWQTSIGLKGMQSAVTVHTGYPVIAQQQIGVMQVAAGHCEFTAHGCNWFGPPVQTFGHGVAVGWTRGVLVGCGNPVLIAGTQNTFGCFTTTARGPNWSSTASAMFASGGHLRG